MQNPIAYASELDGPDNNPRTMKLLNRAFEDIMDKSYESQGRAIRAVHAKNHGVVEASLTVLDGLPPELAQGVFATPGEHQALIRFSTNPGDVLHDAVSAPRGMALKVLDVAGERLPGSEQATTQDFVMANGPIFGAPDTETFLRSVRLFNTFAGQAEWAKKAVSVALRGVRTGLEKVGVDKPALLTNIAALGGAPQTHPLGETFYSQTAFRHGAFVGKYSLVPVSPSLTALTGTPVTTSGRPNALQEDIAAAMRAGSAQWELRVQLCRDTTTMPINDPTVPWSEQDSPYIAVARITAAAQTSAAPERVAQVDDRMKFSPWNGVVDHQPLGTLNKARRDTYARSAQFREHVNGCPITEPRTLTLPS